jgi:hypothetical protein
MQSTSLPNKNTIDQLKMVRKLSKGTDIGDRISDMNREVRIYIYA